jgi:hypothetical protein
MDMLGFLAVLAFFGFAPRVGIDRAVIEAMRTAKEQGLEFYEQAREQYRGLVVKPAMWMLFLSLLAEAGLLSVGCWLMDRKLEEAWYLNLFLLVSVVLMAAHAGYLFWIRNSAPRYKVIEELDRYDNVVYGKDDQPRLVEVLDEYNGYRPERFSLIFAVGLVLATLFWIGSFLGILGIQSESSTLFALGALTVFSGLGVLCLMSSFIAWGVVKGTKLSEFLATVVSEEGLVALPGIKWSNIKNYLPKGVDILDEEWDAAVIRGFVKKIAMELLPFALIIWAFTTPLVAEITGILLVITALAGWFLVHCDCADVVATQKKRFAKALFFVLPILCIAGFLWQKVLPDSTKAYWISFSIIEVDKKPWHNFWAMMICVIGLALFGVITAATKPGENSGFGSKLANWIVCAATGLSLLGVGWNGYCLIRNLRHQGNIQLFDKAHFESKEVKELKAKNAELEAKVAAIASATPPPKVEAPASSADKPTPTVANAAAAPKPQLAPGAVIPVTVAPATSAVAAVRSPSRYVSAETLDLAYGK